MKKFLILTVWMVLGNIIYSQTYYNKEYKEINEINQIIPAHDGGFILAGSSNGNAALVKIDSSLSIVWSKLFGGDSVDVFTSVAKTKNGGYIIGGETNSFGNGKRDLFFVRANVNGDSLWTKSIGDTTHDSYTQVKELINGDIIFSGVKNMYPKKNAFYSYFGSLDSLGNLNYIKEISDTSNSGFSIQDIVINKDTELVVFGSIERNLDMGFFRDAGTLVKFDIKGNMIWSKHFDLHYIINNSITSGFIENNNFVGVMSSSDQYFTVISVDLFLGKLNWRKEFFINPIFPVKIIPSKDKGYIILLTGGVAKLDSIGNMLWRKSWLFTAKDIVVKNDSTFIIVLENGKLFETDAFGNGVCTQNVAVSVGDTSKLFTGNQIEINTVNLSLKNTNTKISTITDTSWYNPCLPVNPSQICSVTVDSSSQYTKITWKQNSDTTNTLAYEILRETGTAYISISTIQESGQNFYTYLDTNSVTVQKSYIYKIKTIINKSAIFPESYGKSSLHLVVNINGSNRNLSWNYISSKTFRIWRGNSAMLTLIDSVQGTVTSYVDISALPSDTIYLLEAVSEDGCNSKNNISTLSNQVLLGGTLGFEEYSLGNAFAFYPNPANNKLTFRKESDKPQQIFITDMLGKIIFQTQMLGYQLEISTEKINNGVYFISLDNNNQLKKVVIAH